MCWVIFRVVGNWLFLCLQFCLEGRKKTLHSVRDNIIHHYFSVVLCLSLCWHWKLLSSTSLLSFCNHFMRPMHWNEGITKLYQPHMQCVLTGDACKWCFPIILLCLPSEANPSKPASLGKLWTIATIFTEDEGLPSIIWYFFTVLTTTARLFLHLDHRKCSEHIYWSSNQRKKYCREYQQT